MRYETDDQKRTIQRWARLAIQLNGALDTGAFAHLSVPVVVKEIRTGDIFALLTRELPPAVWEISKLTDVDRHTTLSKIWTSPPPATISASAVREHAIPRTLASGR